VALVGFENQINRVQASAKPIADRDQNQPSEIITSRELSKSERGTLDAKSSGGNEESFPNKKMNYFFYSAHRKSSNHISRDDL